MAIETLCLGCFTVRSTKRNYYEKTKCKSCSNDIVIIAYWGSQDPKLGFFADLADTAAIIANGSFKCPCCKKYIGKYLGENRSKPEILCQKWQQWVQSFYICKTCNGTWYTSKFELA